MFYCNFSFSLILCYPHPSTVICDALVFCDLNPLNYAYFSFFVQFILMSKFMIILSFALILQFMFSPLIMYLFQLFIFYVFYFWFFSIPFTFQLRLLLSLKMPIFTIHSSPYLLIFVP